jgi:hypothetical protein
MIYKLINDFQIDLFECPKRLGNLSFSIDFDEYLSLERPGFWQANSKLRPLDLGRLYKFPLHLDPG